MRLAKEKLRNEKPVLWIFNSNYIWFWHQELFKVQENQDVSRLQRDQISLFNVWMLDGHWQIIHDPRRLIAMLHKPLELFSHSNAYGKDKLKADRRNKGRREVRKLVQMG